MSLFQTAIAAALLAVALPAAAEAQCPRYGVPGQPLRHDAQSVWVPQGHGVIAGGNLDLARCGAVPGVGHVVQNPDFTMQYDNLGMGRDLEFRVNGSCDTVLLVNAANGQWFFNDDSRGSDPAIRLNNAPSGQYDIWVGTYGPSTCNATLVLESF